MRPTCTGAIGSLRLVVATIAVTAALAGCSQTQLTGLVTGHTATRPTVWVVEPDTSGSTTPQTRIGGPYEHEIVSALAEAAREEATVYGAPIDGNAIADAGWLIDGIRLKSTGGGGNAKLAELARIRRASGLRRVVRQMLRTRPTNGSDILGALQGVSRFGRTVPPGTEKVAVLLTDGAINISGSGGYDIYTTPPDTREERKAVIARFKREGELPDLRGWKIYLGGVGVGISNRRTARATVLLWNELVTTMHATLTEESATLAFDSGAL
jgi:hypothetical protein